MKKIIRLFISFCIVLFGVVGLTKYVACAESYGNFTYVINNETVMITDCDSSVSGSIEIPNSIDGYPVTAIGDYAFSRCSSLTSVTIPDNVTSIGVNAFFNCSSITSITIPGSVTIIGADAFENCSDLISVTIPDRVTEMCSGVFRNCSSLIRVTIPNSVSYIGDYAFSDCYSLESVSIPNNVSYIGAYAFFVCRSLESVSIPDNVTQIEENTFSGCIGLRSINIPDSITCIGKNAFSNCSSLKDITIPDSVTYIGNNAFYSCSGLTSIIIPNSVTSIGHHAFHACNLSDIFYNGTSDEWNKIAVGDDAIPDGTTVHYEKIEVTGITLDKTAISLAPGEVEQLTAEIEPKDAQNKNIIWTSADESVAVVNNGTVTGVAYGQTTVTATAEDGKYSAKCAVTVSTPSSNFVFENGCITRYIGTDTEVYIPDEIDGIKVTSIGPRAFEYCGNLVSITIPASVTKIDYDAFSFCNNIKEVHISDIAAWCNISFGSTYSNPIYCANKLYINDRLITDLIIPNGVTAIKSYAFYNCSGIESITIPASVTSIGSSAFYNCVSLKKVHISDIAAWCNISFGNAYSNPLYYAKNLYMNDRTITDLIIPNGVTAIKNYAFYNCSGLTSVTIPSSVIIIGKDSFYDCKNIGEVHISDIAAWCNISFGSNPLSYASSLYVNGVLTEDLVIPSGVTGVGTAFKGFKGLKGIVLPRTVSKIEDNAFSHCNNLTSVTLPNSITQIGNLAFAYCYNLSSADLPDSVIIIGEQAFYQCSLTSVNIGASTSSIGKNAFKSCELKKITLNKNNRTYVLQNNVLYNSDKTSIVLCAYDAVTEVTIPGTVYEIDEEAFYRCGNLKSVIISNGVTIIGKNAFSSCSSLTSVKIPKSVTKIDYGAFSYCNNLKEVHISDIAAWCNISSVSNPLSNKSAMLYLNDAPVVDLVIPYGVTNIGGYVFSDYGSLESIIIPDSVTSIDGGAFRNCTGLESITIPNSVKSVGGYMFSGCSNIKSVVLPETITEIGESMFDGCNALTNIIIPSSVTKIGALAFNNCSALTSIYIPAKVMSIDTVYGTLATAAPFSNCGNLADITVDENNENYCSENGVLFNKSKTAVIKYPEGKEDSCYEIPHGVENIRFRAFDNCKNLINIKLPDTLDSIEGSDRYNSGVVFSKCKNLSRIDVDGNNNRYYSNDGVLFDKKGTLVRYPEGIEKSVYSIPDGTANIGNFAFYNCDNPKEINIPRSLTSIEENAFNTAAIENVHYGGTKADKENISIAESGNSSLLAAVWHYQGEDDGESKPVVKASEVFGKRGNTVTMNIMLENNPGVALLGFNIGYDQNAMTLVSVTNGKIFDDADILNGNIQKNPYMFTCMNSTENKSRDGVLVSLTFKIADNCPAGEYAINISGCEAYSIDETVVDFKSVNGNVIVSDGTETGVNISVSIPNYEKGGTVMIGLYDESKKLLSVKSYTPAKSINASFEENGAYIKVMQWDMNMIMPLTKSEEIYLN